jgi:NADPH-dependent 2,4-dienoyl-CoA reductase/sulfur reductase-like enzyme/nitrite reductase/ring-hydroxylating ferredoxin subunit
MNYHEEVVASTSDFQEGDMKQVTVGEIDVLLTYTNKEYQAIGAYCTHYGAPLVDGALFHDRVICPWHHACFNVKGKQCEPPGLDDLPSFEVRVDGDNIYVKVPQDAPDRSTPTMSARDDSDRQVYAVVGGGAAAAYAVESMREAGFTGRIVMISAEDEVPYDRPNASKEYLQDEAPEEWMPLRPDDFYTQHGIERLHAEVTSVNTANKQIEFADGNRLQYDKVLLCTGGKANTLSVPGSDLPGVITLRSMEDSRRIRDRAKEVKNVAIIGSSFIGLEAAMSLQKLDCEITVVSPEKVPFASRWGEPVGKLIRKLHDESGIHFELETKARAFKGNGQVEEVILENGKTIPAELVVVGIGVKPATDMFEGIEKAEDGGVVVNEQLQTSLVDVYAAGDIAQFPYRKQPTRIEHWRVACQQGRVAGKNMAGKSEAYQSVPFFWTAQQGTNFRYVGHVEDFDRVIYDGSVEDQQFLAYYVKDGAVVAALGVKRDKEMAALEHLMQYQQMPTPAQVEARFDVVGSLKS